MLIQRTGKGTSELRSRERSLGLRERGALFLLDRPRPLADLATHLADASAAIVQSLLASGHVEVLRVDVPVEAQVPASPEPTVEAAEARRSVAAARMFLFDLCERLLVRSDPASAREFRDALREARDAGSMLDVAQAMLAHIEHVAGAERAATVHEQLAALLPEGLEPPQTTAPAPLD